MNVLFVLNSASGGATLSARDVMAQLAPQGFRFFLVLPPGGSAEEIAALRRHSEDAAFVSLPWWNRNYKAPAWKRPLLWGRRLVASGLHVGTLRRLAALIRRWDVDLVHTNTSLTPHGALAARLTGRPHLWHVREQIGRRGLFRFWLPERTLAATFCRLAAAIVCNSEESRGLFARTGFGERAEVIYNGIHLEAFSAERGDKAHALRRAWGAGEDAMLVGMVANQTSRMKRHAVFLEAAARAASENPALRFVLVGKDPLKEGGYRGELEYARQTKALAESLGIQDRLTWAGFQADVPAVMAALDVLVHPSEQESFGRVAIEAMAAARPVVAADSGGLAEIVLEAETGYRVPDLDAGLYARRILDLAGDTGLRHRLGEAGRERVRRLFTVEATAAKLAAVYQRLATAAARRREGDDFS